MRTGLKIISILQIIAGLFVAGAGALTASLFAAGDTSVGSTVEMVTLSVVLFVLEGALAIISGCAGTARCQGSGEIHAGSDMGRADPCHIRVFSCHGRGTADRFLHYPAALFHLRDECTQEQKVTGTGGRSRRRLDQKRSVCITQALFFCPVRLCCEMTIARQAAFPGFLCSV